MFTDMLAIVISGTILAAIIVASIVGEEVARWWLGNNSDEKDRAIKMKQFDAELALRKQDGRANRMAQSEMVQYYRDLVPQQFKQMREQEERQQAFALESQGREQDFTREMAAGEYEARRDELMLNKLVPQAPTEMSTPEIALRGAEIMSSFHEPDLAPAILPFDPNYPITALSRQQ